MTTRVIFRCKKFCDRALKVAADLATLFLPMNVSSESAQGQFIRVALVAFADNAVIVGDLNKYHNYASLVEGLFTIDYHGGKTLNIEAFVSFNL